MLKYSLLQRHVTVGPKWYKIYKIDCYWWRDMVFSIWPSHKAAECSVVEPKEAEWRALIFDGRIYARTHVEPCWVTSQLCGPSNDAGQTGASLMFVTGRIRLSSWITAVSSFTVLHHFVVFAVVCVLPWISQWRHVFSWQHMASCIFPPLFTAKFTRAVWWPQQRPSWSMCVATYVLRALVWPQRKSSWRSS
jgi:hypothetical protein